MQYSLRSLFLATAAVAVLFAVACTLPDLISISVMLYVTLVLPGATIALIVYGRGYVQAFAIGCAVSPVGPAIFLIPFFVLSAFGMEADLAMPIYFAGDVESEDSSSHEYIVWLKVGILAFHAMNISCGLMAVAAPWLILRTKTTNLRGKTKVTEELVVQPISATADEPYAIIHERVSVSDSRLDSLSADFADLRR